MNSNDKRSPASNVGVKSQSRRSVLKAAGLVAATNMLGFPALVSAQSKSITVTCWGGSYEAAIRKAFAVPFAKETGISVTLVNNADLPRMKVQVESKNVSWDVFDSIGPQIMSGVQEGMWEEIDKSIVDTSGLIQQTGPDHVGTYSYAGGLGYDPARHPDGKHPTTYVDFWDVEKFPGRRGLRSRVSENLEMALLADGVDPKDLYPLDVERGFKALDRIKPEIRKWIETTPETVTLIDSKELDFTYTYISRVLAAEKNGMSIAMSMKQTLNSLEYLAVPKYGKNTEAAMKYVAFCLRPDRQAAFCEEVAFAPNAAAAMDLLSEQAKAHVPDMNDPNSVVINDVWWGKNYEKLQRRFTEWMLT